LVFFAPPEEPSLLRMQGVVPQVVQISLEPIRK
jgi:hypothetical protein